MRLSGEQLTVLRYCCPPDPLHCTHYPWPDPCLHLVGQRGQLLVFVVCSCNGSVSQRVLTQELKKENQKASSYRDEEEVLRKPEPRSTGSQHQWDAANNLQTTLSAQIQLRALQGARVNRLGIVWGYVVVVFPIAWKIYVVVLCYKY